MNYKIKIENSKDKSGNIDIRSLALISENILNVAYGSLQIRLVGISIVKGRKPLKLEKSVQVSLSGIEKGSTVLNLESEGFEKTLKYMQLNAFKQEEFNYILTQTPVSMFLNTYKDALDEKSDKEFLDKPLINKLKNFEKVFTSKDEIISFYNERPEPLLVLTKKDFKKITILEKDAPEPRRIILNGRVEVLEYSKRRVKLITDSGQVEAYISEKIKPEDIKEYWGHLVTISGLAYYRYGGTLGFVEIERIYEPKQSDKYFSKKINSESTERQIQRQITEKGFKNNLKEIIGKWPGDETDDEFEKMVKELD